MVSSEAFAGGCSKSKSSGLWRTCSVVVGYKCFRGPWVTTQKTSTRNVNGVLNYEHKKKYSVLFLSHWCEISTHTQPHAKQFVRAVTVCTLKTCFEDWWDDDWRGGLAAATSGTQAHVKSDWTRSTVVSPQNTTPVVWLGTQPTKLQCKSEVMVQGTWFFFPFFKPNFHLCVFLLVLFSIILSQTNEHPRWLTFGELKRKLLESLLIQGVHSRVCIFASLPWPQKNDIISNYITRRINISAHASYSGGFRIRIMFRRPDLLAKDFRTLFLPDKRWYFSLKKATTTSK
jgi:hypothetical protein